MITVPTKYFTIVKEKLKNAPTFVYSVLDLIIEGAVYADSTSYNAFLIQSSSGLNYVAGNSSNEIVLNDIVNLFKNSVINSKRFTLFSTEDFWNQSIEKYLINKVRKIERYAFSFDLFSYQNRKRNDYKEYDVFKINNNLIENCLEFDKKYYVEYWDSPENFLQNGIGFCVKDREKIISEGVSIFKSEEYAEIDIITDLQYRGKGLASIVAEQFIDYCLSKNIEPRWDCDIENVASITLGSKLGFINPQKYAVYVMK